MDIPASEEGTGRQLFDYTEAMERLVRDIAARCPEFAHIDADRIVIAYTQTRSPGAHGLYASIHPLRFQDGKRTAKKRGRTYAMPRIRIGEVEILYVLYFALPRFADLGFETKMVTIFHELYHISPAFNGDIRRFPGKNYAHGHSRKRYNELARSLAEQYTRNADTREVTAFLRMGFDELQKRYGAVVGRHVRPPRPQLAQVDNDDGELIYSSHEPHGEEG